MTINDASLRLSSDRLNSYIHDYVQKHKRIIPLKQMLPKALKMAAVEVTL